MKKIILKFRERKWGPRRPRRKGKRDTDTCTSRWETARNPRKSAPQGGGRKIRRADPPCFGRISNLAQKRSRPRSAVKAPGIAPPSELSSPAGKPRSAGA